MATKTPDKTLEDIIVNATINTDRLEMAVEKSTHRIVTELGMIPTLVSPPRPTVPTIVGPATYDDKLIHIATAVESVKEAIFGLIATVIGVGLMLMFVVAWLVSTVQHIQNGSYTPDKKETEVVEEANDSEPNTSTEAAASPETPDQSHPQSSSDELQLD